MNPEIPDRLSAKPDSEYWQPIATSSGLLVSLNGVKQKDVIEYSISNGWLVKFKHNDKGEVYLENGDIPQETLHGVVTVEWKN